MEFGTLGRRCSVDGCRQHDYLPFTCSACDMVHCSEHRSVWAHECTGDLSKIVTPDALPPRPASAVAPASGASTTKAKKPKKRRCPAKGCKAKGTFVVSMECKHCCTNFCVSHRFPDQHDCQGSNLDNQGSAGVGGGGIAAALSAMSGAVGGAMGAAGAAAMARFAGAASKPAAVSTATVVASPVAAVACHAAARSRGSGGSGGIGGEGGGSGSGSGSGRPVSIEADADLLGRLLEMGFSRVQASTALEAAANDADRAVELLMMA